MAPAWDSLANEYASSSGVFIGHVDCTVHESICSRFKIEGFPTLKYVQAGDGEDDMQEYEGEMSSSDLFAAARELLVPACTPANTAACQPQQLVDLEAYIAMDREKREALIKEMELPLLEAERKLEALNERLEKLEEKVEQQEDVVETLKKSVMPKLRLLKATGKPAASSPAPSGASADKDEP